MSNSVFQSVILQLKDATDRTFGVIDTDGCVISCTDVSLLGERWPEAAMKVASGTEQTAVFAQKTFRAIMSRSMNLRTGTLSLHPPSNNFLPSISTILETNGIDADALI